jgi:hypothetical protein
MNIVDLYIDTSYMVSMIAVKKFLPKNEPPLSGDVELIVGEVARCHSNDMEDHNKMVDNVMKKHKCIWACDASYQKMRSRVEYLKTIKKE